MAMNNGDPENPDGYLHLTDAAGAKGIVLQGGNIAGSGASPNGAGFATAHNGARNGDRQAQIAHQARRLIAAANELLALAAELEDEAARRSEAGNAALDLHSGTEARAPAAPLEDDVRWLRHARRTYRNRRTRGVLFGDDTLFGEPAWDLLLDLFIAAKERKRVPVTSACIGASVPTTTALRWLTVMEDRGLVLREADTSDARRIFVRLSAEAYAKMVAYFVRAAGTDAEDTIDAAKAHGRSMERLRG